MNWKNSLLAVLAVLTINSCTDYNTPVIEIIQGTHTSDWDEQLDADFRRESYLHPEVSFIFAPEARSDWEEAKQIENAVARGVDAVIINPVSASDMIVPAVEKAFDSGVKVIIVGQKPNTYKYDAYLGVDNVRIGRMAASYVASKMRGEGNLLTVSLAGFDASFYKDREHAFTNTIKQFNGITVTDCPTRNWAADSAHEAIDSIAAIPGAVIPDMIFAFGDGIAMGVLEADIWPGVPVMGVDGAPDTGLPEIQKGNLVATIMNPTRGEDAISTAVRIIMGRPYDKNDVLIPELIDETNVSSVIASLKEVERYRQRVDILNSGYDRIIPKLKAVSCAILIMGIVLALLFIGNLLLAKSLKNNRSKTMTLNTSKVELEERYQTLQMQHEISEASRRSLEEDKKGLLEALLDSGKNGNVQEFSSPVEESSFLNKFKNYIENNLDNSELSMDDIASSLNMSKAQMYRKVRAVSDMTPNELLQSMRLFKADELLKSSDMKIAEVAYAVGFSSPSYFTKCYREKYGVPPKEKR